MIFQSTKETRVKSDTVSNKNHEYGFWDPKDNFFVNFMPTRYTVNAQFYCEILKKLQRAYRIAKVVDQESVFASRQRPSSYH